MNVTIEHKYIIDLFYYLFLGAYFLYVILFVIFRKDINEDSSLPSYRLNNKNDKRFQKVHGAIKRVTWTITIVSVSILLLKFFPIPVIYVTVIIGASVYALLIPFFIWNVIKHVFFKPSNFKLTMDFEGPVFFLGTSVFVVSFYFLANETLMSINKFLENTNLLIADLSLMLMLTLWYTAMMFFFFSFMIFSLNRVNRTIIRGKQLRKAMADRLSQKIINKEKTEKEQEKPPLKRIQMTQVFSFSSNVYIKIENNQKKNVFRKIGLYIIWFIFVILDVFPQVAVWFLNNIVDFFLVFIQLFLRTMTNLFGNASRKLDDNQGRAIIITSKLSLVGSLLIVYFLDSYYEIFSSSSGSRVYEFICSVIIIPLLIAQIFDVRKAKSISDFNN